MNELFKTNSAVNGGEQQQTVNARDLRKRNGSKYVADIRHFPCRSWQVTPDLSAVSALPVLSKNAG